MSKQTSIPYILSGALATSWTIMVLPTNSSFTRTHKLVTTTSIQNLNSKHTHPHLPLGQPICMHGDHPVKRKMNPFLLMKAKLNGRDHSRSRRSSISCYSGTHNTLINAIYSWKTLGSGFFYLQNRRDWKER